MISPIIQSSVSRYRGTDSSEGLIEMIDGICIVDKHGPIKRETVVSTNNRSKHIDLGVLM